MALILVLLVVLLLLFASFATGTNYREIYRALTDKNRLLRSIKAFFLTLLSTLAEII